MNESFLILTGLGYAAKSNGGPLVDQIDAVLPQTQCAQCDYPGCRPYAEAIQHLFDQLLAHHWTLLHSLNR